MDKKKLALIIGVLVAIIIWAIPISNLSREGHICLALIVMTVIFWACQVTQAGFVAGLFLALLVILKVAEPSVIFYSWTGDTMFLVIGAYLIASAVTSSGLGERVAYYFLLRFVKSFQSLIVSIFLLTFIFSILIPHPWPRAFLIMSVMAVVIKSAKMSKEDAVKVGFTVFAASVPVSLIFLTGDSNINPLTLRLSGVSLGWIGWFKVMGLPGIVASVITCILILVLFKSTSPFNFNREEVTEKLKAMGKFSKLEIRTLIWLIIAIVLWMTDSVHHISVGWITLIVAMLMSLPIIGEERTTKAWSVVPVHVLLFLTAAMAIGKVGTVTGVSKWLALTLFPAIPPHNVFILAAFITLIAIVIHMALGSVMATIGLMIPAMMAFTQSMGFSPLVPALLVCTAIAGHYLFPFQHLNMLVGANEETGMYTQRETLRLGFPLIAVVFFVTVLIEIPWWKLIGLI